MNVNLSRALGKKYTFQVTNGTASDQTLYLLTGMLDTTGIDNTITQIGSTPYTVSAVTSTLHKHNVTPLTNAGFSTGLVLDDGTISTSFVATADTSTLKIRQFREFINMYPQKLKELVISSDNKETFNKSLFIARYNPLRPRFEEYEVRLSKFFSVYQNQDNKISIDFSEDGGLLLDSSMIMYMAIQDGRTVTFEFIF